MDLKKETLIRYLDICQEASQRSPLSIFNPQGFKNKIGLTFKEINGRNVYVAYLLPIEDYELFLEVPVNRNDKPKGFLLRIRQNGKGESYVFIGQYIDGYVLTKKIRRNNITEHYSMFINVNEIEYFKRLAIMEDILCNADFKLK